MPSRTGDQYDPRTDGLDTVIFDDADATYNYTGRAGRGVVKAAGSLATAQGQEVWYITRTTKATPYVTEAASDKYDQEWDERASLTTWA